MSKETIKADVKMIQMIKLAENNCETAIINILHMFKKGRGKCKHIKKHGRLLKDPAQTQRNEKKKKG